MDAGEFVEEDEEKERAETRLDKPAFNTARASIFVLSN